MNDVLVSRAELAGVLGLTTRRVDYLVNDGLPTKGGKVLLLASIAFYVDRLRKAYSEGSEAKKRYLQAKAAQEEIKKNKMMGAIISVDDVKVQAGQLANIIKNELLSLPAKMSGVLENKEKEAIHKILEFEMRTLVNVIAEKLEEMVATNESSFFSGDCKNAEDKDI